MKIRSLVICLMLFAIAHAQDNTDIEVLISQDRIKIDQIELGNSNTTTIVPSIFAENEVHFKQSIDALRELTIVKVYYVYTEYAENPNFNQLALDRKRLSQLSKNFPEIISDPYIEWDLIEQTGCQSADDGKNFFHGFIFVHRPIQSEQERLAEIDRLNAFLENPSETYQKTRLDPIETQIEGTNATQKPANVIPDQDAKYWDGTDAMLDFLRKELRTDEIVLKRDDKWVKTKISIDESGTITEVICVDEEPERIQSAVVNALMKMPDWDPARKDSVPVSSKINLEVRVSYSQAVNGMYLINGQRPNLEGNPLEEVPEDLLSESYNQSMELIFLKSEPVYRGLEVVDPFEKCALVLDVTGSMSDHVAAMKRWIHKNNDSISFTSFTFFNDGDGKATRRKKIGETGGIYQTKEISEIDDLITSTMRKGSGGERPESDIEAITYAVSKDLECDAVLLLGDNFSEIRDLSLLKNFTKKVNVLICGAKGKVRVDYLNVAKETGGYLIYNGERIELKHIERGQVLSVGPGQYDYNGRTFILRERKK